MKIHPAFVGLFLTAWLTIQGWALIEISALKVEVAVLSMRVTLLQGNATIATK